jgi:hypothetical protein
MRRRGPRKTDNGEAQHGGDGEQSCAREGGEKGGKPAGDAPYPKADHRRRLAATEEQGGGNSDGDRGAAVKAAVQLGFAKQEAAVAGAVDSRARGGGFIGRPRATACGLGTPCGGGRAVPWPDSDSSPSLARGRGRPRQAGPACQREREGEERAGMRVGRRAGGKGKRTRLGRAVWEEKERRGERPAGLGHVEEKMAVGLGLAGRKRKKREGWCWGRPSGEKEREKELHSNILEFEFEI